MKTKEQKRQEALERFRRNFMTQLLLWQTSQPGGVVYEKTKQLAGAEVADTLKKEADSVFLRFRVHAEVDTHGNPLTKEEVFALKSQTYTEFRGESRDEIYPDRAMVGSLEYRPCNILT